MSNIISYSIVVPVYGAENSLDKLNETLISFFQNNYSFELIYVNDCSPDNSWEVLKQLKFKNTFPITIINLSKNYGQHAATICGFKYCKGEFIITIDDDLEVHPNEIEKLIQSQQSNQADLVYGVYKKLNQSVLRSILTKTYKLLAKTEGQKKGEGSSFRLLTQSLAQKIATNHKHFVFIDELCLWYTAHINFLQVEANTEFINKQRYSVAGLFSLSANVILFSSTFPLKMVKRLGLSLAVVNFLIGCFYLAKKIFLHKQEAGYTSVIVSILFSTGLIIFCIAVIAQYLSHMLKAMNNMPSYSEKEVIC